jgi:hypothetical protein
MPTRNRSFLQGRFSSDDWEYGRRTRRRSRPATEPRQATGRRPASRFAFAACFTLLFFAGASFTAGAGDQLTKFVEDGAVLADVDAPLVEAAAVPAEEPASATAAETASLEPEATAAETAPLPEVTAPAAPAAEPETAPATATEADVPGTSPGTSPGTEAAPQADAQAAPVQDLAPEVATSVPAAPAAVETAPASRPAAARPARAQARAVAPTRRWVVRRAAPAPAPAPEIEHAGGQPTIWLNRALPDPTPASARLKRGFAKQLAATSVRHGADWAAVLALLRAQGERSAVPATPRELNVLAERLGDRDTWKVALAISGRTGFADRAAALADLYRSVGLEALVTGFAAAKERLTAKLLDNEAVWIYAGGRDDLGAGRVDVRVVVLLNYLAERHESVLVSSLFSGHRTFARPGVVSAHVYGHAVDIAAVGGTSIAGHQQPGGPTEAAVRSVLLLPAELQPQQVISLLGLGGPSFALADHGDHIHVGY